MAKPNQGLEAHLFVCTNQKPSGECCAPKGGIALRDHLKTRSKARADEWSGRVRINASGCLGRCSEGVVAVLYPQGKWFTQLDADSGPLLETAIDEALPKAE